MALALKIISEWS